MRDATSLAERTNVIRSSGLQHYPALVKLVPVGALLALLASLNVESFSGKAAADETPVTAAKDSAADSEIPVKAFAGRVLKPDGSKARGSQIVAVRYEPVGVFDHRLMTTADDQGVFSLKLPGVRGSVASWGVFAVLGDDGGMLETAIEVANPQSESNVHLPEAVSVIELKPGRKVQGTIIDDVTQSPVSGAQVFSIDGRVETTDEQGRFQFRGLRADIIEFVVRSNGRQTLKFAVDASERGLTDVTHIEVPMSPGGMVRGRVVDPDGSPVPGATVHAAFARSVFSSVLASTTDEHGRFSLDGLALNRMIFPLEVSVFGYDRGNGQMFAINRANATFEMALQVAKATDAGSLRNSIGGGSERPSLGVIAGRVTKDGVPVRNIRVRLLPLQKARKDEGRYGVPERVHTSDDGRFQIGQLEAGCCYRILVAANDGSYAIMEPVYAQADPGQASTNEVQFTLKKAQRLVVKVVDAESGLPIANAAAGLMPHEPRRRLFAWNYRLTGASIEWTDKEGRAVFDSLSAESGTVFVEHPGYERMAVQWPAATLENGTSDNAAPLTISLRKEARLRLRISGDAKQKYGRLLATVEDAANDYLEIENIQVNSGEFLPAMSMLPPGTVKITLKELEGKSPTEPIVTRWVELHSGDNDLQMDLPEATIAP
ncbi:MAG: carboxypeptidase regulatory-like domain-containing protein [Planctomycetaceae bacterium]